MCRNRYIIREEMNMKISQLLVSEKRESHSLEYSNL